MKQIMILVLRDNSGTEGEVNSVVVTEPLFKVLPSRTMVSGL